MKTLITLLSRAITSKCGEVIAHIMESAPHGSGFDVGTKLDTERCTRSKLVFSTSFHHMNDVGMYDGWTEHTVTIYAKFDGVEINVSGRNRNGIKDHIGDVFHEWLDQSISHVFLPEGAQPGGWRPLIGKEAPDPHTCTPKAGWNGAWVDSKGTVWSNVC